MPINLHCSAPRLLAKGVLPLAAIAAALFICVGPSLADYTGPDRMVTVWEWKRKVCHYQAVYDPPGTGWYGCTLELYEPPDGSCPGNVAGYFTPSACGWSESYCQTQGCSISSSSSIEGCSEGQQGCRAVSSTTTLPAASVSGSVGCGIPGSGGWCRGGGVLNLSGSEPLAGYSILALEGTHYGKAFACAGDACQASPAEGDNDFTFWAVSSYGDTSSMSSASGKLDSRPPVISGGVSGTPGENGWYVSEVTVNASASDPAPGSGLVGLDASVDGGGWAPYGGPIALGEGTHSVSLRASDAAGNSASQELSIAVDSTPPGVSLSAGGSFCPGCGETLSITIQVSDDLSGVASWELAAGGISIASGGAAADQTLNWDDDGLPAGQQSLRLEGRDAAGNTAQVERGVQIVAPTATPLPPPTKPPAPKATTAPLTAAGASAESTPTPIAIINEMDTSADLGRGSEVIPITPTRAVVVVPFGGPPQSPAGSGETGPDGGPLAGAKEREGGAATGGSGSGILWGAAAAALMAGVTAYALQQRRRREEAARHLAGEMARRNALAEARDRARAAAVAATRWARDAALVAAAAAADAARQARERFYEWRLTRKQAMLEKPVPSPPRDPALDLAAWKQADMAQMEHAVEKGENLVPTQPAATPGPERVPTPPLWIGTPTPGGTPMPDQRTSPPMSRIPPTGFTDPQRFDQPLTSLKEGQSKELRLGRLMGYAEWGLSVGRGFEWPNRAPTSIGPEGITSKSGPVGAKGGFSHPRGTIWFDLPGKATVPLSEGGRVDFSRGLYVRAEGKGLNTVWTLGYQTRWSTTPGVEAPLPVSNGAAGYYVKVAPVQTALTIVVIVLTVATLGQIGPIWQPQPGIP